MKTPHLREGVHIQNWARTFSCAPGLYGEPENLDELKEILEFARLHNRTLKIVGRGHSPSDIAFTDDGILVSLKKMKRVVKIDEKNCRVTAESGLLIEELNHLLTSHGLAFSVLPSISDLTIGGAVTTATHGSGIKYGTLSSYIVDMELLLADGSICYCSRDANSEIFRAASCGIGAICIIVQLTFQCERSFNLSQKQYGEKLSTVLSNLDSYIASSDHFKFLWYPHTDDAVVFLINRKPENSRSQRVNIIWATILQWTSHFIEFLYWISTFLLFLTPWINRFAHTLHRIPTEFTDISYNVFNFDCLFQQYVSDWAIPVKATAEVVSELKKWLENQQGAVVAHFPVEIRFVKGETDAMMSPAYGRDTAYINIIMYRPYGKDVEKEEYWNAYEQIMEKHGGRPHWAKEHKITASKLRKMYPLFDDWCQIRKELDPEGIFVNEYLARLLIE